MMAALLVGLLPLSFSPSLEASICGSRIFALTEGSIDLIEIDSSHGDLISQLPLTITGGVVTGTHALAGHWIEDQLYALVDLGAISESILGLVNVDTGLVTVIGGTGHTFVGMTIDGNGVCYAVTGENDPTPESLYTIDLTTGASTFFCTLGTSDDGEVIAALPYNSALWHVSGTAGAYDPLTDTGTWFERLETGSTTPCASTPLAPDPFLLGGRCTAITALASGLILWKEGVGPGPLHFVDPYSGMVQYSGFTNFAVSEIASLPFCSPQPFFRRGDTNDDGAVNIGDPIFLLQKLFSGVPSVCEAAEDANGDNQINIADPIRILGFLFAGSPPPPEPFFQCGFDPFGFFLCSSLSCP